MTSGVIRARVRSLLRCRMISCPAANEIRWVNPSMATVSPSRTIAAIASRIVATFDAVTGRNAAGTTRSAGDLAVVQGTGDRRLRSKGDPPPGDLPDRVGEQPKSGRHLGFRHGEGGRHPDAGLAAFEDEQAALEAGPLDLLGVESSVEFDADHQPAAANVADEAVEAVDERSKPGECLLAAGRRVVDVAAL